MEDRVDISIVVPVFNASMTLEKLSERTVAVLQKLSLNYEIIFVDDGSQDQSWNIITSLKTHYDSKIIGIQLSRNYGQQIATMCGLQRARGTWIVTLDDDLQIAPEQIETLWKRMEDMPADVIYGAYTQPKNGWVHNTGTRVFHRLLKMVAPDCPRGSSFRLIRSDILKFFPVHLGPWIFIDPILAWLSSSIVSVPVTHEKKNHGKSGYSFFKLLNLACQALIIYSSKPFRLIIWIALMGAGISFVIGLYFIIQKLTVGSQLGFSAIIVTISFASSMILFCLGVLGEYIYRIYGMNTGRPAFTIKKLA
jgi:glycosyltransferase involved in cell wall biosynthesis